jgi:hypothetical protein
VLDQKAADLEARTATGGTLARYRSDRTAIAVLAVLPVLIYVVPALAGHPVLPGDDLTQSLPLRELAGQQLRHGQLPLLDPYIWSGAPLLGGWNAGAAYPLTALFAVLPGSAAWTINMTAIWWAAGLGTFAFLRALRLSPVPSLLGALSFAFAGAMAAQVSHVGLEAGLSWVPLALLAVLRLSERRGARAALGWSCVLAIAVALVILAGEPRAITDAVIIVGGYAAWRACRAGWLRGTARCVALVLGGSLLGVAAGAVQLLPGVAAVDSSQRITHGAALFNSGSLEHMWLLLFLVPDLFGGSGSFGQPAFFSNYNLTEVTSYVGLVPLVAAVALLVRRSWRPLPEWLIWHLLAVAGVLLALGSFTPLGHLLIHVPFFGGQRLQSRNLVIADFALAVLLGYWAQEWLDRQPDRRRLASLARRLASAVPAVAAVAVAVVALIWGPGLPRWLGLSAAMSAPAAQLRPWVLPAAALGCLAVLLVWYGPRLGQAARRRALVWFVSADLVAFTLLAVVAIAPGSGGTAVPAAATGGTTAGGGTAGGGTAGGGTAGGAGPPAIIPGSEQAPVVPASALIRGGRFAIYDPALLDGGQLPGIGSPDGNITAKTPSIEGYSAIVDATYASVTGSHLATGDGQDVLSPRAIGDGTLDQLGTSVLLTPAAYLITPAGSAPASPAPPGTRPAPPLLRTGARSLAAGQGGTWYLGAVLPVTSVTIPVSGDPATAGHGVRVGLVPASGPVDWLTARPGQAQGGSQGEGAGSQGDGGSLTATAGRPVPAVAIRVVAGPAGAAFGAPLAATADGNSYRANGPLQDALVPPRWTFDRMDGAFAVFRDTLARPPLTLRTAGTAGTGRPAGASARATAGPAFAPDAADVTSPHGVTVIRSAAAIPGWTARWQPDGGGPATTLPVRRSGLVQAVTVPAGRGRLSWRYSPPGARPGLLISLAALIVLAGLAAAAVLLGRRARPAEAAGPNRAIALGRASRG